jgi:hypothetical protein
VDAVIKRCNTQAILRRVARVRVKGLGDGLAFAPALQVLATLAALKANPQLV